MELASPGVALLLLRAFGRRLRESERERRRRVAENVAENRAKSHGKANDHEYFRVLLRRRTRPCKARRVSV